MRLLIGVIVASSMFFSGCASEKVQSRYYESVTERDIGVNTAVTNANAEATKRWYEAVERIATSDKPNASAGLVMLAMTKPTPMEAKIQMMERPERGSDYTKMALGVAGIWGLSNAFGDIMSVAKNASGTVYNLSAGGDINKSANQRNIKQQDIGGDANAKVCPDCEEKGEPDKHEPPENCPGGVLGKGGVWWTDDTQTCSCDSRSKGKC